MRTGDTIIFGKNAVQSRQRRTVNGVQSYDITRALVEYIVEAYNLQQQVVYVKCATTSDTVILPLCHPLLGVGPLGGDSYCPPDYLPYGHPGMVINVEHNGQCVHRMSGEKAYLKYGDSFIRDGAYTLTSLTTGDSRSFTSTRWERSMLKAKLDSLKGTSLAGRGSIYRFMDTSGNILMHLDQINLRRRQEYRAVVVFPDGQLWVYPLTHIT